MPRVIGIGHQNFETLIQNNYFYIDKTNFIKEWWENGDLVTLITRPRRFGKTLNMSMVQQFFSMDYAGKKDLFENLSIWETERYRKLQGTYPVISLSFANVKETLFSDTKKMICQIIADLYREYDFLLESGYLSEEEQKSYRQVSADMEQYVVSGSLRALSGYLSRYYGKKAIILLDEYGMNDKQDEARYWYDGFTFGESRDIYNPWSVLNYLKTGKLAAYWANTSSNRLIGKLIRESGSNVKIIMEDLLRGKAFHTEIDEQLIFDQLDYRESGFGRYDVLLEPMKDQDNGMILEFKVQDSEEEKELSDTVKAALKQIAEKNYEAVLAARGIPKNRIRKYGFAFHGKKVLIG